MFFPNQTQSFLYLEIFQMWEGRIASSSNQLSSATLTAENKSLFLFQNHNGESSESSNHKIYGLFQAIFT